MIVERPDTRAIFVQISAKIVITAYIFSNNMPSAKDFYYICKLYVVSSGAIRHETDAIR